MRSYGVIGRLTAVGKGVDPADPCPLFCSGISVFAQLVDEAVSPTAHLIVLDA
jgi:uncharacterized zinc-type alcohol dehydrogenase-like protein